jgi:transglutaminase-like putative cysteine protease
MSLILIAICIATTLVSQICFAAEMVSKQSLQAALERSGENRAELDSALRKVKGKDTEYLLSHANQYDLVNLTAGMIIENVTYARKVHVALPYLGEKLDDEMWREWVLPQRVLDEDLCLWRKAFYERLQPVVSGATTVREAVEAVHGWLMTGDAAQPAQVRFGGSEDRYKTPVQMLKFGRGACGELSMTFVYLLRAVGIPARHCVMTWQPKTNDSHYYCEYWDTQDRRWVPVDCSDEKPIAEVKTPA